MTSKAHGTDDGIESHTTLKAEGDGGKYVDTASLGGVGGVGCSRARGRAIINIFAFILADVT